ncbi:hypothetical protein GGX14DRAFT_607180 [Mycena pura]|uniref:F-box domain-containing protein n=1 Tax=Mycena pura TaxID=153505 RepID=A0AAD6VPN2_9AGAR|nr:hypothetical protein GGX14DRAFT_607180 [Mycena pura]
MLPAIFAIQELCDEITYHIVYSQCPSVDLQSATLVCRTLCLAAQPQLFRHVSLSPYELPWRQDTPPSFLAAAARRLASTLAHSPHLLPYIHSLGILCTVDTMQPLSTFQFPALKAISFVFGDTKSPDKDVLQWAHGWIALATMQEVVITGRCREIQVDHLGILFEGCSPNLIALTIYVTLKSTPTSAPISFRPGHRAHISRLALTSSGHTSAWLASAASPFEFSGLVDLNVIGFLEPAMKILGPARRTITRLQTIAGRALTSLAPIFLRLKHWLLDLSENIDMSDFRALEYLEMGCSNPRVITTLPPDNSVRRLVVYVSVLGINEGRDKQAFSDIDILVTKSPMPALRDVEIRVGGSSKSFDLNFIKSLCPQLAAKYKLVVTDHRRLDRTGADINKHRTFTLFPRSLITATSAPLYHHAVDDDDAMRQHSSPPLTRMHPLASPNRSLRRLPTSLPHSPLIALPAELLELVAFHVATRRPNLGPPAALLPLLCTCRAVHARLGPAGNPALWASIARAKFVFSPAFFELCPLDSGAGTALGKGKGKMRRDAAALRTACEALAVIRTGDPHLRTAGAALQVAYALLVADDGGGHRVGKNRRQLAWASARAFALRFVRSKLWAGRFGERDPPSLPILDDGGAVEEEDGDGSEDEDTDTEFRPDTDAHTEWRAEWGTPVWRVGWPRDTRAAAAALWVLWFFEGKGTHVFSCAPKSKSEADPNAHLMTLLLPFICAPFRYASALAPPHHYSVPLLPGVLAGAGTGAAITIPTFHGAYPIYVLGASVSPAGARVGARTRGPGLRARGRTQEALGPLLCASPARLLFFARMQAGSRMGVPPHLARDRVEAEARWRAAGNTGPMPVGPTQADIYEKNARPLVRFEPQLPALPSASTAPVPQTPTRGLTYAEPERAGAVEPAADAEAEANADKVPSGDGRWAHHRWRARLCRRYHGQGMWDDGSALGPAPGPSTSQWQWQGRGGAPSGRIGHVYELGSFAGLWAGTLLMPSETQYTALIGTPGGALPPGGLARDDFTAAARPVYMRIAEHWSFHPQSPAPPPAADGTTGDEGLRGGWLPPRARVVSAGGGQIEVRVPAADVRRGGEDAHVYETVLDGRVREGAHDVEKCPGCARAAKRAQSAKERERARARTVGVLDDDVTMHGEDSDVAGGSARAPSVEGPGSHSPPQTSSPAASSAPSAGSLSSPPSHSSSPTTQTPSSDSDTAAWPEWDVHRRLFASDDDEGWEAVCDGVQDVVFTGATDPAHGQAWHHYEFAGRVRPWDGLIGLVMRPRNRLLGLATYFIAGHLVGRDTFEGTWQMAAQDVLAPSWGGSLCLARGG